MTSFLRLDCDLPAECEESLAELLTGQPVLGSHLEPLGDGWLRVAVYLPEGRLEAAEKVAALLVEAGGSRLDRQEVERTDWLASYRSAVRPFPVGRQWWMDPHPDAPTPAPDSRLRLAVEPRMAFGTGSHESTQLVLLALEEMSSGFAGPVTEVLAGMTVLDVGTGSGVLALAADRLGAGTVIGFDVDPEAIWVARQIARQQEWPARPRYFAGRLAALGAAHFDLVLCNMIPEQATPLFPDLARLLARPGRLILSGLLASQRDEVAAELDRAGLQVLAERHCHEWAGLLAARQRRW
jgi:ribosomal protein L11 methyltransferase